ncbi:MAG: hypothetical protein J2P58_14805 [Acidimicrobiaceae bacterium]|nr:hypothetical protein [Acidimicrobiaceae bacterium]
MTHITSMTISCDDCTMQGTAACAGCVVTYLCDPDLGDPGPADARTIDPDEVRAVRMLGRAGLTPPLRHRRRRSLVS